MHRSDATPIPRTSQLVHTNHSRLPGCFLFLCWELLNSNYNLNVGRRTVSPIGQFKKWKLTRNILNSTVVASCILVLQVKLPWVVGWRWTGQSPGCWNRVGGADTNSTVTMWCLGCWPPGSQPARRALRSGASPRGGLRFPGWNELRPEGRGGTDQVQGLEEKLRQDAKERSAPVFPIHPLCVFQLSDKCQKSARPLVNNKEECIWLGCCVSEGRWLQN